MACAVAETPLAELQHCWGQSRGEEFNVRAANYKKLGRKEPSLASFYDLAAFDFIKAEAV